MKMFILCLFAVVAMCSSGCFAERKNWGLLIAGSAGYDNYRHQADICHAYQILKKAGIPDEQIVVMMYDDIANNDQNPFPGNIINKPNGPNVYTGVPKDYTGSNVNADMFLKVLSGDKEGVENILGRPGKVIESGPEDYVFVNFADHGGPGILGMPSPPYLKARDLTRTLKEMADAKKFAKLTFYVEACYSGSMFDGLLPTNIDIYVTTAANTDESSYAYYFDEDRQTYLGDLYSISWMENDDVANMHTETLEKQYMLVKKRTNSSHVMQYGDQSFTSLSVDQFIGDKSRRSVKPKGRFSTSNTSKKTTTERGVPSELATITSLQSRLSSKHPHFVARRASTQKQLQAQLWIKAQTEKIVETIASQVLTARDDVSKTLSERPLVRNWDCYESTVDRLFELCPRLEPSVNDFVLSRMHVLVNLCNTQRQDIVQGAVEKAVLSTPICY